MNNHTATWLRGQHQYIFEEGDACEQTPKHAQTDSVATINTLAGGRANVEQGLQTGLDIVATMVWWDWQTPEMLEAQEQDPSSQTDDVSGSMSTFLIPLFWLTLLPVVFFLAKSNKKPKSD